MHNGQPSTTDATTGSFVSPFLSRVVIVIDGRSHVLSERMFAGFSESATDVAATLSNAANLQRLRMRRAEMRRAELELQLEALGRRSSRPRPIRAHFPEEARAPRHQARAHAPRRTVVPMEWDRAMRARWVR